MSLHPPVAGRFAGDRGDALQGHRRSLEGRSTGSHPRHGASCGSRTVPNLVGTDIVWGFGDVPVGTELDMELSEHELKQLEELEKQFETGSRLGRLGTRLRARYPTGVTVVAGVVVAVAAPLILLFLPVSVGASFGFFLATVIGLFVLFGGRSLDGIVARLRDRSTSDPEV